MPLRSVNGRVTFTVDPTMYGELYAPPLEVYGNLDRVVRPDLHYHYSSPVCAQRWLNVCDDPAYGHQRLLQQVEAVFPEMLSTLRRRRPTSTLVHLVSLGPGDGTLDLQMLRSLEEEFSISSYCALDFSFDLLRRAVNRIAGGDGFRDAFPINAICGDFTDVSPTRICPSEDGANRIFALTGFTLGNYNEDGLIRGISELMGPGDHLFVDARLHRFGPLPKGAPMPELASDAWSGSYDIPSVRGFVFGPVEMATEARAEDADIAFELSRVLTTVPGAVNVSIHCRNLDTRMRLTGEPISRPRLDLAVTTAYDFPGLQTWFAGTGLSLEWSGTTGDVGFFLLRKP
jgi:hypothetical protein